MENYFSDLELTEVLMSNSFYNMKSIDELTFTDNGMFQEVLKDPQICSKLIERLLHVQVNKIQYPKLEKRIAPYYTSKGVRLDVYLKDSDKIIDIEMQSSSFTALGKRTRYYQSMIDIDALLKGEKYPNLKDSYILFICKEDPFQEETKKGFSLPCYTFKNICLQNSEVNLNDKSLKVIYNASAYEKETDQKIRDFLHFVYTNIPGEDDFTKLLSATVEKIKDNDKFRRDYAAMNLHDFDITEEAKKQGRIEGIEIGVQQKAEEDARGLYTNGVSIELIAKSLKMTEEEVREIVNAPVSVKA